MYNINKKLATYISISLNDFALHLYSDSRSISSGLK